MNSLSTHTFSLPQVTLKARAREDITIDVAHVGTCNVECLVSVLHRGVHFSAVFQTASSDEVVLWKEGKIEAADGPRVERMTVCGPGMLLLKFSNAHSMMREKNVVYRVDVVPTAEGVEEGVEVEEETKSF